MPNTHTIWRVAFYLIFSQQPFRVNTPVRWAWLLRNRRIENQGEKSDDAERSNAEVEDRLTVIREIKAKFKQN